MALEWVAGVITPISAVFFPHSQRVGAQTCSRHSYVAQHSLDALVFFKTSFIMESSTGNETPNWLLTILYTTAVAISSTLSFLNISSWQIICSRKLLMLIPTLQIVHYYQSSGNPASTSIEIFHIGRKCTKLLASLHLFLIITPHPNCACACNAAGGDTKDSRTFRNKKKACNHVRGNFQHPWMDYLTTCNQLTGVLLTVRKL